MTLNFPSMRRKYSDFPQHKSAAFDYPHQPPAQSRCSRALLVGQACSFRLYLNDMSTPSDT